MGPVAKKRLLTGLKLAVSAGVICWIYNSIFAQEHAAELWARLRALSWGWVAASALSLLTAICLSTLRWHLLLVGQGIHASARHLIGSFMIGRFFGAVTIGGLGIWWLVDLILILTGNFKDKNGEKITQWT